LGLPLVHIRLRGGVERGVVKAWIAGGDAAIGLICAFGGIAIAPISFGGFGLGLLTLGGFALGPVALGGFSLGIWAMGGLAAGWQSFGGLALAWNAALGGAALAHDYALGGIAQAALANSPAARFWIQEHSFFAVAQRVCEHLAWINLLWLIPLVLWWRSVKRPGQETGSQDS
jgi:hypothetical protein